MKKPFLHIVLPLVVCLIINPAVGSDIRPLDNYRTLYNLTDTFGGKFWRKEIISEVELREVMKRIQIKDDIDINKAVFRPEQFNKMLEEQCTKMNQGAFLYFASLCKAIYEKSDDRDRILVFEIFKHVSLEIRDTFIRIQRKKDNKLCNSELDWEKGFMSDSWEKGPPTEIFGQLIGTLDVGGVFSDERPATPVLPCEWFCDKSILDRVTNTLQEELRKGATPIQPETVKGSLLFLRKVEEEQKTNISSRITAKPQGFQKSYEEIVTKMSGERFLRFAMTCMGMYEELCETHEKIALYILFLSVSKKEKEFLRLRKVTRRLAEIREDAYPADTTK
ncbi:MAG: hypothetical protein K2Y18_10120 [Alphaproteobacteria bacterium]|jgi:hypothetical protein|nr:hypothetical protein [Alphaproteobacteria bacterium]